MADLVTLAGDYNYNFSSTRTGRRGRVSARNEELMGDLFDYFKSAGSFIVSPFVAVGKGIGHAGMEFYRGAKTGDFGRMLASPFRGAGHTGMTLARTSGEHAEYYWRPSKMKDWMKPIGATLLTIGAVPGPHSVFFIPIGAALTIGGTIGETVYINDQIKKAQTAQKLADAEAKKKANYIWYGVAAIGAVGVWMVAT